MKSKFKIMSHVCLILFIVNLLVHLFSFFNFNNNPIFVALFFLTTAANIPCIWIIPKNSEKARGWAENMPKSIKIFMFGLVVYGVGFLPNLDKFTSITLSESNFEFLTLVLILFSLFGYSAYSLQVSKEMT